MKKLNEILHKLLFVIVSVLVFVAVIALIIFTKMPGNGLLKIMLFVVPGLVIVVALSISVKRDEKKEKEYKDKYVEEVVINDKVFGEMKFQKDNNLNTLRCDDFKQTFGTYHLEIKIEDYDENEQELYFRSLECLYNRQEEIIETLFEGFVEAYSNSKEVTHDKLKENFAIKKIVIDKCDEYLLEEAEVIEEDEGFEFEPDDYIATVYCDPNQNKLFRDYYAKYPMAYLHCKSKKIIYVLEE